MILITGASGTVGSAVLSELDGADECIALTHHKVVDTRSVRGDVTKPWLGLHPADYRELAAEIDVVVHCAASVNFSATDKHLHRVNVVGTGNVLRFAEDAGARIVYASSAFVIRAGDGSPFDAYAATKATAETLVRESGLPACIARISTVIGDSRTGDIPRLHAFHYILGFAMSGKLPFLPCTPGTLIDLIPRDTVAAALVALARNPHAGGEYWFTAGEAALSIERIIDLAGDAAATRVQDDEELRDIDPSVFRTRLVDRAVAEKVITRVLAHASSTATPSVIERAANLMVAYDNADPFPTSLGSIPTGPPALSTESGDDALRAQVDHLAKLPSKTWDSV